MLILPLLKERLSKFETNESKIANTNMQIYYVRTVKKKKTLLSCSGGHDRCTLRSSSRDGHLDAHFLWGFSLIKCSFINIQSLTN